MTVKQVTDTDLVDLLASVLDSPYANYLTRQFTLAALTKISSRPGITQPQQDRIQDLLASYTTSPELEIQQRAVELASLFTLDPDVRAGVLERMPPPELKATVMGVGELVILFWCLKAVVDLGFLVSENKPVGSVQPSKDVGLLPHAKDDPTYSWVFILLLGRPLGRRRRPRNAYD